MIDPHLLASPVSPRAGRGLSRNRLEALHGLLRGHVESGRMPGLAALVARDDDVDVFLAGTPTFRSAAPLRRDAIFRIASLTKPITAVAAMILVEQGRLRLDDPVDPWLPELASRPVLRSIDAELDDTVAAARAITVRDVLTYRMGFGSVMAAPDTYPIQRAIRELRIGGDGPPRPKEAPPRDEWLRRLGSLPWMAQPGERWMYHVSGDVLGALVARVAGGSLGEFMRERIFEPLGMKDTAFSVPPGQRDRLAGLYCSGPGPDKATPFEDERASQWFEPAAESGGGGLVGTLDDYFTFSRMMMDGGRLGRARILSRASVSLMTTDHLLPAQRAGSEMFFGAHSSWGLGVAVDIARQEIYHSPGRFGWTGGTGTTAYVDPVERLVGILFTQRMMESPDPPKVFTDFWQGAYAALDRDEDGPA
jgi:CubicO group peptidase (beta-lactamase class C family)